jgi:anti-sigma factor RsiW
MTPWKGAVSRMRCMRSMPVLQSYLDGNVDEGTARRVAAHLEGCRRCGLEAEVYLAIKRALANDRDTIEPEVIDRLQHFASHLAHSGDPTAGTDGS